MSYTEIYKFKKNGDAECFSEVKNAWRGAMAVWNILDKKYLPKYIPDFAKILGETDKEYFRSFDFRGEALKEVWDLSLKDNVSKTDKICLRSTFDNVVVLSENLPELLRAFRDFEGETSLPEQADAIEKELKNDPELLAIAWSQTSVNGGAWESDELDDDENYLPYNILKSEKHWSMFADAF
jgi:hypothetical protein